MNNLRPWWSIRSKKKENSMNWIYSREIRINLFELHNVSHVRKKTVFFYCLTIIIYKKRVAMNVSVRSELYYEIHQSIWHTIIDRFILGSGGIRIINSINQACVVFFFSFLSLWRRLCDEEDCLVIFRFSTEELFEEYGGDVKAELVDSWWEELPLQEL